MEIDFNNTKGAPGLLIAPPSLQDPNFKEAVVVVCVNESEGAMGFILNRPSELKLHEILKDLEIDPIVGDRKVLAGGPVSNYAGFIMYEHDYGEPLAPGIEITKSISILSISLNKVLVNLEHPEIPTTSPKNKILIV